MHHINPEDFHRRRFVDTNGEVAAITVAVLAVVALVPLDRPWSGPAAVFGLAFCGLGSMTNQIHQRSHMPSPPAIVRSEEHTSELQSQSNLVCRLLLEKKKGQWCHVAAGLAGTALDGAVA